jgi:uncharacterized protein YkwD
MTIITRSSASFDPKKVGAFLSGVAAQKEKTSGKYYYAKSRHAPEFRVVYMPSDRVVVMSDLTPDQLGPVFKADGVQPLGKADLVANTAKLSRNPAWAVYAIDPGYKPLLLGAVNQLLPKFPPNLHSGLRQAVEARTLSVALGTENEQVRLAVSVEYPNPPVAGPVAQALNGLWDGFKVQSSQQILAGLKPFPGYFQGLVKDAIANTQVAATENRVEAVARIGVSAFQGLVDELAQEGDAEVMVCFNEVQVLAAKPPPAKEPPFQLSPEEKAVFDNVNKFRMDQKLPPLKPNPILFKVARAHVKLMAEKNAPDDEIDGKNNEARLKDIGYEHNGTAVNVGTGELGQLFGVWFRALAPRTTILEPKYTETGIGVFRDAKTNTLFVTQIYATPK